MGRPVEEVEVSVFVDPSFYLAKTIQCYRERLQNGLLAGRTAKAISIQSAALDPASVEFRQQLEARVYEALEETLQRWKRREIATPACIEEMTGHCAPECWPRVFVLASETTVTQVSSASSALGYRRAPLFGHFAEDPAGDFDSLGLLLLRVPPVMDLIAPLAELDGVKAIYDAENPVRLCPPPLETVGALLAESVSVIDPGGTRQRIGLDRCGRGIRVCVCDTGIDATHPDLAGAVEAVVDLTDDGDGIDRNGHGTHVAGIIAGRGTASGGRYAGVAPGATLLSARVLDSRGAGSTFSVIAGLKWALDRGADVVNLSLGHESSLTDGQSLESRICNVLVERGVVVVVSAGNSGPGPGSIGVPGDARSAITVGALSRARTVCSFSSRGPTSNPGLTGMKPEVLAPGEQVVSCRAANSDPAYWWPLPGADGYARASGTSMAAPMVSGVAALLLAEARASGATLPPLELKRRLCATCSLLPGVPRECQGHGIVNLTAAAQRHIVDAPAAIEEAGIPHDKKAAVEVNNEILSVEELSDYLKLKPVTLYKLLRQGRVPGFKVGGAWRFRKATIDEWIARREQSGEMEAEEEKMVAAATFSVDCGLCGIRLKTPPANRCEAEDCDVRLCDKCWNILGRHFCKDHRSQQSAPAPHLDDRCCLCGGHTDLKAQRCEEDGCWNIICDSCRNGRSAGWVGHPRRYCIEHKHGHWSVPAAAEPTQAGWPPAPAPVPAPARDRVQERSEFGGDLALALVAAESAFIERTRTHFAETSELYHPSTGNTVSMEGAWSFVREESEFGDILRHPAFRYDPHNVGERLPTNRSLTFLLKFPRGVLDKKPVALNLQAKFWAPWEGLLSAENPLRPRSMTELSALLAEAAATARKQKLAVVLALLSPTGWEPEAIHYVVPEVASSPRFSSPDVSVILLGANAGECWFDATDTRAAICVPLVQGELQRDVLRRCEELVEERLTGAKYLTVEALAADLPFHPKVISTAMERLATASSDLKMEVISGVGLTLRRK
jgi:excisionase family DNA binding protein